MRTIICTFMIVTFVNGISGLDFFSSLEKQIDRTALSIFDKAVNNAEKFMRKHKWLNDKFKLLGTAAEDLDDYWSEIAGFLVTLPTENYEPKKLAKNNQFLELAKYAKYGLYTQYSDQKRVVYHFGMRNSWNFWVAIDSLLGVLFEQRVYENKPELTDTFLTDKFLTVSDLKNFMAWRGVSGSDDIGWAGLGLVAAYQFTGNKVFLDKEYEWNGARGCSQLYQEIYDDFYDFKNGGIFWGTNRLYKDAISNSLWVLWSAELYQATGDKKYLDEAYKIQDWLVNVGKVALEDGTIYDGFKGAVNDNTKLNTDVWSYNFGTFVGAVGEFYKITKDKTYMKTGQMVIENAFKHFNKTGYFSEDRKLDSDGDAFKGIFFKYVSKFLVHYWEVAEDQETKDWILKMRHYFINQAKIVVYHKMNDDGLFSAYWSPDEDMKFTPTAQISALDLFLAAHRVSVYIK